MSVEHFYVMTKDFRDLIYQVRHILSVLVNLLLALAPLQLVCSYYCNSIKNNFFCSIGLLPFKQLFKLFQKVNYMSERWIRSKNLCFASLYHKSSFQGDFCQAPSHGGLEHFRVKA